jgi:hypothetical protein
MSFIEQVSLNHISPWLGGGDPPENAANAPAAVPECKVWRNPLNLFRGAEYQRFQTATKKVRYFYNFPKTFYKLRFVYLLSLIILCLVVCRSR